MAKVTKAKVSAAMVERAREIILDISQISWVDVAWRQAC
jgi:hypothetical protein